MLEEGVPNAPTVRREPWNDVMAGLKVGVSGSDCH